MRKGPKVEIEDPRDLAETERIREATLKRLLATPPKQHKEMVEENRAKTSAKGKKPAKK